MTMHRYTDLTKPIDTTPPKVDVVMIQVRDDEHPWVEHAVKSVTEQSYANMGLLIIPNADRSLSIGRAWNAGCQASDADLVLFLGDDDMIVPDLITCLVESWSFMRARVPNLVRITSPCIALEDDRGSGPVPYHHTGMFVRQYLLDHPFNEELAHGVGHAQARSIDQAQRALGQPMSSAVAHHYGYIFRQHPYQVGGQQYRFDGR